MCRRLENWHAWLQLLHWLVSHAALGASLWRSSRPQETFLGVHARSNIPVCRNAFHKELTWHDPCHWKLWRLQLDQGQHWLCLLDGVASKESLNSCDNILVYRRSTDILDWYALAVENWKAHTRFWDSGTSVVYSKLCVGHLAPWITKILSVYRPASQSRESLFNNCKVEQERASMGRDSIPIILWKIRIISW